jgi:hypothetical protein
LAAEVSIALGKDGNLRVHSSALLSSEANECPYSLTIAKSTFSRQEPILWQLVIRNSSDDPLPVSLGYDREGAFIFNLKRPDGSLVELPRKPIREGLSRIGTFTVKPHTSYTQQLILNQWYDFSDPGIYEISATLKEGRQSKGVCLNAIFASEILPLDTAQLQKPCSELVEVVRSNSNDFEKASDAAKAMLVIKHPVVVPCLEGALKANHAVSSFVIRGLEEIGNNQAVEVLIPLLRDPNPEDSDFIQARAALLSIEKRTTDSNTLNSIKTALAKVTP